MARNMIIVAMCLLVFSNAAGKKFYMAYTPLLCAQPKDAGDEVQLDAVCCGLCNASCISTHSVH
jgi:hypothetical protein